MNPIPDLHVIMAFLVNNWVLIYFTVRPVKIDHITVGCLGLFSWGFYLVKKGFQALPYEIFSVSL